MDGFLFCGLIWFGVYSFYLENEMDWWIKFVWVEDLDVGEDGDEWRLLRFSDVRNGLLSCWKRGMLFECERLLWKGKGVVFFMVYLFLLSIGIVRVVFLYWGWNEDYFGNVII